ncbi:hypothetical protein [Neolewinella litorea]|uniref:Uncharacterized protein n=1 Tax=Neolewinella litorea TaxID=2562452 RepID=A0A4S4NB28_9BACT|nr:hypothetical protein [Neolewinella litorea]THH36562.1 hypothetical protein E4021_14945 [Neolewinella litorea]
MTDYNHNLENKIAELKNEFDQKVKDLSDRGKQKLEEIQDNNPDPSAVEAGVNMTFDVVWETTSLKFDIPKFTSKLETIKFDIPEVRSEIEEISFSVPAIRMVRTCLFKKPVFRDLKMYSECVYGNKPETYSKVISFKTDIPKIYSKKIEVKFDKPSITMETVEVKMNLPQFHFKNIEGQIRDQEDKANRIASEMQSEIAVAEHEFNRNLSIIIPDELSSMFDEIREDVLKERESAVGIFETTVQEIKNSIHILKNNNAVEKYTELERQLSQIIANHEITIHHFDTALREITLAEEKAVQDFKGSIT